MPTTPPSTLADIPDKVRRTKLASLLNERAVLGYTFSWAKLLRLLRLVQDQLQTKHGLIDFTDTQFAEMLNECVIAFKEDTTKELKEKLNEEIADIISDYDIKTVREPDPFGRVKDFILMNGVSTSMSQSNAIEIAVADYGYDAEILQLCFDRATKRKGYTTVQCRDAKDDFEPKLEKQRKGKK